MWGGSRPSFCVPEPPDIPRCSSAAAPFLITRLRPLSFVSRVRVRRGPGSVRHCCTRSSVDHVVCAVARTCCAAVVNGWSCCTTTPQTPREPNSSPISLGRRRWCESAAPATPPSGRPKCCLREFYPHFMSARIARRRTKTCGRSGDTTTHAGPRPHPRQAEIERPHPRQAEIERLHPRQAEIERPHPRQAEIERPHHTHAKPKPSVHITPTPSRNRVSTSHPRQSRETECPHHIHAKPTRNV